MCVCVCVCVIYFAFCGHCFDLQWEKPQYTLLGRPNKVETAVQCSCLSHVVLAGFFCHGNSSYNIIPLIKKMYIHFIVYGVVFMQRDKSVSTLRRHGQGGDLVFYMSMDVTTIDIRLN